ncbi:MAG: beta-lactamase family protein, partial [Parvularculaceae bacterium]|nr:beta-lactamase family protein [Parvularculaceae bacterium]
MPNKVLAGLAGAAAGVLVASGAALAGDSVAGARSKPAASATAPVRPAPQDMNSRSTPDGSSGSASYALDTHAPARAYAASASKNDDKTLAQFARLVEDAVSTGDFVGLAVAVVRHGEIRLIRTYGVKEIGGDDRVTTLTRFRIASLSKGMTGALAALAIDEGRVSPDEPVAPYAPTFRLRGGAQTNVTFEHVLSHRVGLP